MDVVRDKVVLEGPHDVGEAVDVLYVSEEGEVDERESAEGVELFVRHVLCDLESVVGVSVSAHRILKHCVDATLDFEAHVFEYAVAQAPQRSARSKQVEAEVDAAVVATHRLGHDCG